MRTKLLNNIVLYSFLLSGILTASIEIRIYVISELELDSFSGFISSVISLLLFLSIYISLQSIIDFFIVHQKSKSQSHEQEILNNITADHTVIKTTDYEHYKSIAQHKIIEEQERILQNVLSYTHRELALYLNETDLKILCKHIRIFQFATLEECEMITASINVSQQLKSIDIMHFGWNIGNQFKKSGIETATFLRNVFHEKLHEVEISTIKRKLRAEGTCLIKIQESLDFHKR